MDVQFGNKCPTLPPHLAVSAEIGLDMMPVYKNCANTTEERHLRVLQKGVMWSNAKKLKKENVRLSSRENS